MTASSRPRRPPGAAELRARRSRCPGDRGGPSEAGGEGEGRRQVRHDEGSCGDALARQQEGVQGARRREEAGEG